MYLSIYTFVYVGIAFRLSLSPFHLFLYLCMYTFAYLGISFVCFCTYLCTPTFVHFLSDSVSALILPSSFLSLSVSHPLVGRRQSADCKIRKTHKKLQTLIPMSSRLAIPLSRTHARKGTHFLSEAVWPDWAIFERLWGKILYQKLPKYLGTFGSFWKTSQFCE